MPPEVRFGSKADIGAPPINVRYSAESGHGSARPLWCVNVQPPGGKLTAVMSTVVLIGRLVRKLIALRLERDRSEQPLN